MKKTSTASLSNDPQNSGIGRPAHPLWIIITFIIAYLTTLALSTVHVLWVPDVLALTLLYWTVRYPRHIGMTIAFFCGILSDIHTGSVLGQQALAYVILSFSALIIHRRMSWFSIAGQAMHILPILFIAQIVVLLVRLWFDGLWPGLPWFLQSLTGALLWPVIAFIYSWPERHVSTDNRTL